MTHIFNVNFENNSLSIYLIKNFNTHIIRLSPISDYNYNNYLNNNEVNENRFLIRNSNNENILFEFLDCDINLVDVLNNDNYNIQPINQFNYNNYQYIDNIVWISILGRINL
tara:strand:+ start:3497 stop:3832 length:336 start_codon:yes stop_codon:yes gene_type:complete